MTDQDYVPDIVTGNIAECIYCHHSITEVIDPYSGVVDWGMDGDFGCDRNPISDDEGVGSHHPVGDYRPCGVTPSLNMGMALRLADELERLIARPHVIETRETGQPTVTIFDRIGTVLTNWRVVIDPQTSEAVRNRIMGQDQW